MPNPLPTLLCTLQAGLLALALVACLLPTGLIYAAPGDVDSLDANIVGSDVFATAVQPDGKTIIVGDFSSVLGVARNHIARLNADGTLDMSFDPNANQIVISVAVQPDGKVLIGGLFTTLQPNGATTATARNCIARVNANGTLDTGFNPNANSDVYGVAMQVDGKILLGGLFTTLQPNGAPSATARRYIARVNANGTLDTGFDPKANGIIYSVVMQADGKVLLGGGFSTLQPNGAATTTVRNHIARVNANGTLDTSFDPNANNTVNCMAVQADGKVLLGGYFATLQPNGAAFATGRNCIARVNGDGTLDTGFDPKANSEVYSMVVQADGKVLLGGLFTAFQSNGAVTTTVRSYIARVNADGTLDNAFDPHASYTVNSVTVQADGKVLLGGRFTSLYPNGAVSPTMRNCFARLYNDPATQTLSVPNATEVLWTRGGSAPELSRVTFEFSTNGGTNWTQLGTGTRIGTTPNWQLVGLSLPATGQIRARGVTLGGYSNGTSGLIEQVITFNRDADNDGLLDSWELSYWPSTTGHNPLDDSDHDGYCELLELALGLNPTLPSAGGLPAAIDEGGYLTMTITKQPGVTYEVLSAGAFVAVFPTFSTFSTTVLINDATTLKVRDNFLTTAAPARFMRVKVTAAP